MNTLKQSETQVQHTPGPWVIDRGTIFDATGPEPIPGHSVAGVATAFSSITIRATSTAGNPCPSCDSLDAIGEANARLIAAAPELLDALKLAEAIVTRAVRAGACPSGLENKVRAAIAKAVGK